MSNHYQYQPYTERDMHWKNGAAGPLISKRSAPLSLPPSPIPNTHVSPDQH